jgi:hypothetical protein
MLAAANDQNPQCGYFANIEMREANRAMTSSIIAALPTIQSRKEAGPRPFFLEGSFQQGANDDE